MATLAFLVASDTATFSQKCEWKNNLILSNNTVKDDVDHLDNIETLKIFFRIYDYDITRMNSQLLVKFSFIHSFVYAISFTVYFQLWMHYLIISSQDMKSWILHHH